MKTPIQELIEEIDLTVYPKSWKEVFKMIEDKYIEKEKQMIIDAVRHGDTTIGYAEQYYNEKFKQ